MSNEHKIVTCPICGCVTELDGRYIKPVQGLVTSLGFSDGGWGHRQDEFQFSGEVCNECFIAVKKAFKSVIEIFNERKNINKEQIFIRRKDNNDNPSGMRNDKPQSKRFKIPLLRFLS